MGLAEFEMAAEESNGHVMEAAEYEPVFKGEDWVRD